VSSESPIGAQTEAFGHVRQAFHVVDLPARLDKHAGEVGDDLLVPVSFGRFVGIQQKLDFFAGDHYLRSQFDKRNHHSFGEALDPSGSGR
jgi:hypothetical protein